MSPVVRPNEANGVFDPPESPPPREAHPTINSPINHIAFRIDGRIARPPPKKKGGGVGAWPQKRQSASFYDGLADESRVGSGCPQNGQHDSFEAPPRPGRLTCVSAPIMMTPMANQMKKTQVYLDARDLAALHRVARGQKKSVALLVREAIRLVWLRPAAKGPVAIWDGPFAGSSADHDAAFDEV